MSGTSMMKMMAGSQRQRAPARAPASCPYSTLRRARNRKKPVKARATAADRTLSLFTGFLP